MRLILELDETLFQRFLQTRTSINSKAIKSYVGLIIFIRIHYIKLRIVLLLQFRPQKECSKLKKAWLLSSSKGSIFACRCNHN